MRYRTMLMLTILGICLQSFAQTEAGEADPNTSTCFGQTPTPSWCDANYNNGLGFPGWNDNESRTGLDPIRTPGINIRPANVSKLNIHNFLGGGQGGATTFVSMQMWFSTPQNTSQPCSASAGTGGGSGVCRFDGANYPLAASHLMNGSQDCPWQGPAGGSGDCGSSASAGQTRWNEAVKDVNDRGFDGVIAINQGGHNTCLQSPVTHANGTAGFGSGSSFNAACGVGSNQYRAAQATFHVQSAMQNALNSAGNSMSSMKFLWMEDSGAWKFDVQCGVGGWGNHTADQRLWQVVCVQTKLRADFQWASANLWNQPQSYTAGGTVPLALIFDDIGSGVFLDSTGAQLCTSTSPCTMIDASTCPSVSQPDCWTAIWNQHRAWMQNTLGTDAKLLFRDGNGFTHAQSDGAFLWLAFNDAGAITSQHPNPSRSDITSTTQTEWKGPGQGCDGEASRVECFYHRARQTLTSGSQLFGKIAIGGLYKGFDPRYAQWWYPNNPVLSQMCGKSWLNTLSAPALNDPLTGSVFLDATHVLPAYSANTWDDYEEGTEIQTGIDNCYTTTASATNRILSWQINTSNADATEDTIQQYEIFQDTPTVTFARIATIDRSDPRFTTKQFDVSSFIVSPPNWFYVQARGKASITDHLSSNVDVWPSTGTVTISGFERTTIPPCPPPPMECDQTPIYDSGSVTITINGVAETAYYGDVSTSASIASDLASAFNSDPASPVTATLSGSTISFKTKLGGSDTHYSLYSTYFYDDGDFNGPSFTGNCSGSTMTGGVG